MNKQEWRNRIIEAMNTAGTYRPFFDTAVDTLAGILERRDAAADAFDGEIINEHTNKIGATNIEINPALQLVNALDRDALSYLRALGLTPAGLKRINEKALERKKSNALMDALKELGG